MELFSSPEGQSAVQTREKGAEKKITNANKRALATCHPPVKHEQQKRRQVTLKRFAGYQRPRLETIIELDEALLMKYEAKPVSKIDKRINRRKSGNIFSRCSCRKVFWGALVVLVFALILCGIFVPRFGSRKIKKN